MNLDSQSIKDIALVIAMIMVIADGIFVFAKARNGELREAAGIAVGVFIGALVIALASHLEEVGNWLYGILF